MERIYHRFARGLLQDQPQAVEQLTASDCQRLAGISIGGWIVVSLFCGVAVGIFAVLAFQSFRRRQDARYARMMPANLDPLALPSGPSSLMAAGTKPLRSSSPPLPPLVPAREPMQRPARSVPMPAAPGKLGPLTASVHVASIHTPGAPIGKDGAAAPGAARSGGLGPAANRLGPAQRAPADTCVADQQARKQGQGVHDGSVSAEQHADVVRQFATTEYVVQGASPLSSPGGEPLPVVCQSPEAWRRSEKQQQEQQQQQQLKQSVGMGARASAATSATGAEGAGARVSAGSLTHPEIDDAYEPDDLDEDWKALLGDVDSRLAAAGAPPMDARERAVAIKKLLVATATKGVDFAMGATLEEVLRFRNFHAAK